MQACSRGDRAGICVTQLDAKLVERGLACTPGAPPARGRGPLRCAVARRRVAAARHAEQAGLRAAWSPCVLHAYHRARRAAARQACPVPRLAAERRQGACWGWACLAPAWHGMHPCRRAALRRLDRRCRRPGLPASRQRAHV